MKLVRLLYAVAALGIWVPRDALAQRALPDFDAYPKLYAYNEFGDAPLYGPDYSHWGYRNPEAPDGGHRQAASQVIWQTFANFGNTLANSAPGSQGYDRLFISNADELYTAYVYLGEYYQIAEDRSWVLFKIRDDARWHDGTAITADDVAFSYDKAQEEGFSVLQSAFFAHIDSWQVLDGNRFFIALKPSGAAQREFPFRLSSSVTIVPESYWADRHFDDILLQPPLMSGPYKIRDFDMGTKIVWEKIADYWADDHPANAGAAWEDTVTYTTVRDREAMRIAFLARDIDQFVEGTMERWVNAYERQNPLINAGVMYKEALQLRGLRDVQMLHFNLRRDMFSDPRVRRALTLAFDFETMNEQFFYGAYTRNDSFYPNYAPLTAVGVPQGVERQIIAQMQDLQSPEAFAANMAGVFTNPRSKGGGDNSENLQAAFALLTQAGYSVAGDRLLTPEGEPFTIKVAYYAPAFERIWQAYADSLRLLGIDLQLEVLDAGVWIERLRVRDYDVVSYPFSGATTPGDDIRAFFSTEVGETQGTVALAGLADPFVDALFARAKASEDLEEIEAIGRVFDRHMRNQNYGLLLWGSDKNRVLWWDYYGRPSDLGIRAPYYGTTGSSWWKDAARVDSLPARLALAGGLID